MDDKNFPGYFDKLRKERNPKTIFTTIEKMVEVLIANEHELKLTQAKVNVKSQYGNQ